MKMQPRHREMKSNVQIFKYYFPSFYINQKPQREQCTHNNLNKATKNHNLEEPQLKSKILSSKSLMVDMKWLMVHCFFLFLSWITFFQHPMALRASLFLFYSSLSLSTLNSLILILQGRKMREFLLVLGSYMGNGKDSKSLKHF